MRNFYYVVLRRGCRQGSRTEPVVWFALIVTIAALLTWGWCSISYTTKLEQKVNLLEERVRRYRWECERLELEKQLKRGVPDDGRGGGGGRRGVYGDVHHL